jgi:DNA mismatch endonuclease (patch repair protein)
MNPTIPEIAVQILVADAGAPDQEHGPKDLPGKPDVVVRAWKLAVFVNGCYWHQHRKADCHLVHGTISPTMKAKFIRTRERFSRQVLTLRRTGWRVVVIWECEIHPGAAVREQLIERIKGETRGARRATARQSPPSPQISVPPKADRFPGAFPIPAFSHEALPSPLPTGPQAGQTEPSPTTGSQPTA